MSEKFELYKKLADEAQTKLSEVLSITNEQYSSVRNDEIDMLTQLTDKRGKLIDEYNLINEEMENVFSGIDKNEAVMSFKKSHNDNVDQLKNDIFNANKKLEEILSLEMKMCRSDIKSIAENKEALSGYGHLDYPNESAYFDKRNC